MSSGSSMATNVVANDAKIDKIYNGKRERDTSRKDVIQICILLL